MTRASRSTSLSYLRACAIAVVIIGLSLLMAGCTGRGGGWLPPDYLAFASKASFGFTFSCEDRSSSQQQTGRLQLQLSYTEHGTNSFLVKPFSIHGRADVIDPVLESAVCIGKNPPPGGNELIFLGTYRPNSTSNALFPQACRTTAAAPCRFEVIVRDNDGNAAPSAGDYFAIRLSGASGGVPGEGGLSQLAEPIIYARNGFLGGGNIRVD